MSKDQKPSIGFGRQRDPDPNGTGDGFRYLPGDPEATDKPAEKPKRPPVVVPIFVGDMEAQAILFAYDIFPLTPLGRTEHQLIQIIAALEQRVYELKREA